MHRFLAVIVFLASICAACCAPATVVVTIDGKAAAIPVIEQNGKAFIDAAALMKLLGGSATYTAASHKLAIATKAPAAGAAPGKVSQPGKDGPKLGEVYTVGKESPIVFSLKSAEFTTDQVVIGENIYAPTSEEKLLVLRFTVQNPGKADMFVRWDSLKILAVDSMNVNHEAESDWGDQQNHRSVGISLQPLQNLAVYTVIRVPAKGSVPKLMVQSPEEDAATTLRYDLRDSVSPLKAPVADPADPSGCTALDTITGALNTTYSYDTLDITVEKFETVTKSLGEFTLEEGERFLMVAVLLKNDSPSDQYIRWDSIQPVATSTDGEEYNYREMLLATGSRAIAQDLKPGAESRARLIFIVPAESTPKTLAIKQNESRTYEFAVPQ